MKIQEFFDKSEINYYKGLANFVVEYKSKSEEEFYEVYNLIKLFPIETPEPWTYDKVKDYLIEANIILKYISLISENSLTYEKKYNLLPIGKNYRISIFDEGSIIISYTFIVPDKYRGELDEYTNEVEELKMIEEVSKTFGKKKVENTPVKQSEKPQSEKPEPYVEIEPYTEEPKPNRILGFLRRIFGAGYGNK